MDLIDRQAAIDVEGIDEQIRCEMCRNPMHTDRGCDGNCKYDEKLYERIMQILDKRIKSLPSAQPEPKWIPIETRPMDEEERAEWSEKLGYDIEYEEAVIYTSQLPDDGQEVLTCNRYGHIRTDTFANDPDYGCFFEEYGEMDGIVAWMPLPKPYEEG